MFKVTHEKPVQGAIGAGDLADDATATHEFTATAGKAKERRAISGVTDGQGHDQLEAWARAIHGADSVEFTEVKAG